MPIPGPVPTVRTIKAYQLVGAILRFHHILERRLDAALNGCGLSFAQFEILVLLTDEPKLHAGEVARRLSVTRQTAHGLMRQLERADLIELFPKDGAIRCAWLTDLGRTRLRQSRIALETILQSIANVPAQTQGQLVGAPRSYEDVLVPRPTPWWLD